MSSALLESHRVLDDRSGNSILLCNSANSPLTNQHPSTFTIGNLQFKSVDHYYQYYKCYSFGDEKRAKQVLKSNCSKKCREIAMSIKNFDAKQWAEMSDLIMHRGVKEKFMQNYNLRKLLIELSANNNYIAVSGINDPYWTTGLEWKDQRNADASQWCGNNKLGTILNSVRWYLHADVY